MIGPALVGALAAALAVGVPAARANDLLSELSTGVYRRAEGDGALVNRLDLAAGRALGRALMVSGRLPVALVRSHPGAADRQTGAALGNLSLALRADWPPGAEPAGARWLTGGLTLSLPTTLGGQSALDAEALHRVRRPGDFRDLTQLVLNVGVGLPDGPRRLLAELALITVLERGRPQIDAPALRVHGSTVVGPRSWGGSMHVMLQPDWDVLTVFEAGFDHRAAAFVLGPRVMVPVILPELGLAFGLAAAWP